MSNQKNLPKWPHFAEDEITAVADILRSGKINYWTGGECKLFEKEFADFIGVNHAISLANGTVALELALHALEIGPGDDVIVPCRTFIASASCVVACGARPIVADVDPVSQNLTAETISQVLTPKTKAIIAVHLAGWPCAMDEIINFATKHNLKIIEDCAQAHGAKYRGKCVGSFGDIAAFSFCQDKIISTGGEGGMLVTNNEKLWQKAWSYKDHGKNPHKAFSDETSAGFRWLHESFGTNWRMTEMQAGIGRIQLRKLPSWLVARQRNAAIFNENFKDLKGVRITVPERGVEHAYYKYYVFVQPANLKTDWSRDRILRELSAQGIPCGSGSCGEVYLEQAFIDMHLVPSARFKTAQELSETSLMFVVHPTLNEQDVKYMAQIVREIFIEAALYD